MLPNFVYYYLYYPFKMNFTKEVERLVNPMDVGSLHFIQSFYKLLPKIVQKKLVESSAKNIPYMGFVVEPYATFLCYEIEDTQLAESLLPNGFKLIKTKIFEEDDAKFYCIFGCFTAHTSAFWGTRAEFYIIAEDNSTGLLSWIIVDYDSNTISYDKKDGLRSPNSSAIVTTDYKGTVFVDVKKNDNSREVIFSAESAAGISKALDQRLWLEGNLSIGYGRSFGADDASIFSLKFNPKEVETALEIPADKFTIENNTWFPGLFKSVPSKVLSFPYAQHFISDSPGAASKIKNEEELVASINNVDFKNIKVFSTKSFKTMFIVGSAVSFLTTLTILVLLIIK